MRLTWRDRQWEPDDLEDAVDATQLALKHLGLRPGHRVGVVTGNSPLRVFLQEACAREEVVLAAVHRSVPESAMADQLRRSGANIAITDDGELRNRLDPGIPVVKANPRGDRWDQLERYSLSDPPAEPAPLAAVLHTSGTTGTPRAVGLPRTAVAANATASKERLALTADDAWLGVLPLYHAGGFALVDRCLRTDAHLILHERFDVKAVLAAFRNGPATHSSFVPTMLRRILDEDDEPAPGTVRGILVGGDRTPEDLVRRGLERGWPIYASYGLTETVGQVATASPDELHGDPSTVGRPLEGVTVSVVDEEGRAVGPGTQGEIVVSGPTVGFRLDGPAPGDALRTGDRGHLDDAGRLHVAGRQAERIVSGGVTVDPKQVADVLRRHPDVQDACVVGLPDEEWGEVVAAALVMRPGVTVGIDALRTHCKKHLAESHAPRRFLFLKRLPTTPTGKPDPQMVRTWLARQADPTTAR